MLMEREKAVAPLDTGAAALEQIGTLPGDLLEVTAGLVIQRLDRVRRLSQRGQALGTECPEAMALLSVGAARGGALQIERRDQVVEHGLLDRRCEVQCLYPGVDHHEEERQRGHKAVGIQSHINPTLNILLTDPHVQGSPMLATRMMVGSSQSSGPSSALGTGSLASRAVLVAG